MLMHQISDWDDAYANMPHIPGGEDYPSKWAAQAKRFRQEYRAAGRAEFDVEYGAGERNTLDIFHPDGTPKGLIVFVHGGFWRAFDKSSWSHLAAGPLAHGYSVALPSYTLCPDIRIAGITDEVGEAVTAAARKVDGAIRLAGHSAGGHLVTRMVCRNTPLPPDVVERIRLTVSISGVHDLRPLMRTELNDTLNIDRMEALTESPALLEPVGDTRLICWVGGGERAEFLRQNALLASIWKGLGAATVGVEEPDRHHFNVVEGLQEADHPLTCALCG
ncbi:alpha/beta hydrolase [Nitratireductor sp. XY-223]|uniref:alpha/beta hydrolase n=1 Tax=Nitratireductor sp. XY-223 TaxID=2561926 RepID=UPI0010A9E566|nr:alpha/beta hydrolase [Nitratireductor sp. XY-223]